MNGWKNYETWCVSLWILNFDFYNNLAKRAKNYSQFLMLLGAKAQGENPDGVLWADVGLDIQALDKLIEEIA